VELGIIIDGASLAHAIESHPDMFMDLADHCKTIICCRVTPLQKALVVRMVREMRKALTLAVGDGGNDVSMIQEAHVGVGIFGKEGTQAARAGDYAISEFKHLQRLLSIHGRFSYVRTAGMINLSFYKNIFFTLTQVLFQIYNFDTGTTFQDQWIVAAFNVIVTAAPPFLYGIFERDLEESTVTRFPGAYASNRRTKLFSLRTVVEFTMLYGLWHCICVFFGTFFGLGYLTIPFKDGKDGGLYLTALGSSVMIVIIALSKFILHSHILNWVIILFLALSFAAFFALIPLFVVVVQEYPLRGLLGMLFSSPQFYLTCALVIVAAFAVDFVVLVTRRLMFPDDVSALQRWEQGRGRAKVSEA
jgi:phospholipid-transporting ATPase